MSHWKETLDYIPSHSLTVIGNNQPVTMKLFFEFAFSFALFSLLFFCFPSGWKDTGSILSQQKQDTKEKCETACFTAKEPYIFPTEANMWPPGTLEL